MRFISGYLIVGLLLTVGCSSPDQAATSPPAAGPPPPAALRTEYWPIDTATTRADTLLADGYRLRWTSYSLRDSAVVDTVRDAQGPLLQYSHNEQTRLRGERNGRPLFEVTLGKELFGLPVATDMVWGLGDYRGRRGQDFVFLASLCVPDSDVCETAEIGVSPTGEARLLRVLPPEPME